MKVIKPDVIDSSGSLQVCAGQISGSEAATHAMCNIFDTDDTDAILLIDASNAFNNSLNRAAALHNLKILCPIIATYAINTYRLPTRLSIVGGHSWWTGVKVMRMYNAGRPIINGYLCNQFATTHYKLASCILYETMLVCR